MEEEYEVAVKFKKEKPKDEKAPEEKKSETDSDAKSDDSASVTSTDSTNSDAGSDNSDKKSEDSEKPKEDEVETRMEKRIRKHTYKLEIKRTGKSHKAYSESKALMAEGRSILKLFKEYEQNKLRTAESKNR